MTKKISFSSIVATSVIMMAMPLFASAAVLSMQLEPGMTNSDVSALQTFLAADAAIYPEGIVSGFYGPLTVAAVKRYQTAHGLSAVGRVGPATLASINGMTDSGNVSGDINAPTTLTHSTSVSTNSATVAWTLNEGAYGRVMYATYWPFLFATAATVSSTQGLNSSQVVTLNGLQSHTTYFYVLESTDPAGNLNWTIGNTLMTQ